MQFSEIHGAIIPSFPIKVKIEFKLAQSLKKCQALAIPEAGLASFLLNRLS